MRAKMITCEPRTPLRTLDDSTVDRERAIREYGEEAVAAADARPVIGVTICVIDEEGARYNALLIANGDGYALAIL
ncbi:hypothetical protein P3T25_005169 [Paraburkholderia sp. GAS32]